MGSKNVETLKGLIDAFNARKDLDAIAKAYGDQAVLVDHARNETLKGRAAVKENWSMWATAFSDGKITDVKISYPLDLTTQMLEYDGVKR